MGFVISPPFIAGWVGLGLVALLEADSRGYMLVYPSNTKTPRILEAALPYFVPVINLCSEVSPFKSRYSQSSTSNVFA